jgi:hypothetical protein
VADIREQILSRLVTVCAVTGIVSVARNRTDVPLTQRPAVVIVGGAEEPHIEARNRFSGSQVMALTPQITVLVRADDGTEAGALLSLFRSRLLVAIPADATLRSLVTANGGIRYVGCSEQDPLPESKEPRLDLNFVFHYPLILSDLAA